MKPLVSVVLPCYNESQYIEDCLNSLTHQTYKNIEIILIDDKSTDDSIAKAKKFKIKIYKMKKKGFHGGTRQKGVDLAKGSIIVQTEADAHYPKDFIEKITKPIREGKADATAISLIKPHKRIKGILADFWEIKRLASHELKKRGRYEIKGAIAMKKSVVERVGGYKIKTIGEDVDLANRMKQKGYKIVPVFNTYFYHADPSNWSEFLRRVYYAGDKGTGKTEFHKKWDRNYQKKEAIAISLNLLFFISLISLATYPIYGWFSLIPFALSFIIEGIIPLLFYKQYKIMPWLALKKKKLKLFFLLPLIMYFYTRFNILGRSSRFFRI